MLNNKIHNKKHTSVIAVRHGKARTDPCLQSDKVRSRALEDTPVEREEGEATLAAPLDTAPAPLPESTLEQRPQLSSAYGFDAVDHIVHNAKLCVAAFNCG